MFVCPSGGLCPQGVCLSGGSLSGRPPPPSTVQGRRYASCWNAFFYAKKSARCGWVLAINELVVSGPQCMWQFHCTKRQGKDTLLSIFPSSGLDQCEHTIRPFIPLRTASASITASTGGGSTAFARKGPIPPSLSNLMDRASSCSGVRNISGVVC